LIFSQAPPAAPGAVQSRPAETQGKSDFRKNPENLLNYKKIREKVRDYSEFLRRHHAI
jgi:hypothetical protein